MRQSSCPLWMVGQWTPSAATLTSHLAAQSSTQQVSFCVLLVLKGVHLRWLRGAHLPRRVLAFLMAAGTLGCAACAASLGRWQHMPAQAITSALPCSLHCLKLAAELVLLLLCLAVWLLQMRP